MLLKMCLAAEANTALHKKWLKEKAVGQMQEKTIFFLKPGLKCQHSSGIFWSLKACKVNSLLPCMFSLSVYHLK